MIISKDKYIINKFKSIDQLKNELVKKRRNLLENRANIKICVLDNEGFIVQPLAKLGYKNIDVRERFDSIHDFEKYNVVLCDIDGIGADLDSIRQGLVVVEQITKVFYPKTCVIIYTGKELSDYQYREIENVKIIRKNISSNELSIELDEVCSVFWDPLKAWEILEQYFRDKSLPNKEIAILEDIFIEAINKNTDEYILKRQNRISNDKFREVIKNGTQFIFYVLEVINATKSLTS